MSVASRSSSRFSRHRSLPILAMVAMFAAALAPVTMLEIARGVGLTVPNHLVVSEVVTGGASASDELIELHNPTTSALPLEGLEVIYVTSTRRDDHATRRMGGGSAERSSRRPRPHRERVGHLCLDRRCHVCIGDGRNRRQRRDSHPRRQHRGRRCRLGHDDELLARGGAGDRSRDRCEHRAPARRSARLRHRHGRQRRRLCRAPRPRTAEPRLGADAGPGCGDPAAPSVGDARRTSDHARSDADHDADPDGDPRAASGDPDRGGSRGARWDRR